MSTLCWPLVDIVAVDIVVPLFIDIVAVHIVLVDIVVPGKICYIQYLATHLLYDIHILDFTVMILMSQAKNFKLKNLR